VNEPAGPSPPPSIWRRFLATSGLTAVAAAAALYGLVVASDPYGIFVSAKAAPGPIMDINQRYMYPQIVRSRRFDAAIFGTSTVRLLDPRELGGLFGARFANLAMNAGTPWEHMQLAELFLRHTPEPAALVFGIDPTWCAADADKKRLTFRPVPPWLYDERRANDWPGLFNLTSVQIAFRITGFRLGLMRERVAPDGFEVFTPPEAAYDIERARRHLWGGRPRAIAPVVPAVAPSAAERAGWRFPALAWLDELLGRVPRRTIVVVVFPPAHVSGQPVPGSAADALEAECKRHLAAIAGRHGAAAIDFRSFNATNAEDANYWDPLHYRLPVAARMAVAIHAVGGGTAPEDDSFYRVLNRTSKRGD
jgi:hypothetical protein